jgi:hypothetical protein
MKNKEIARMLFDGWCVVLVGRDGRFWWQGADKIGPTFRNVHKALVWGFNLWGVHDCIVDDLDDADEVTTPCEIGVVDRDGTPVTLRLTRDGWGWRFVQPDKGWGLDWTGVHRNVVQCLHEAFMMVGDHGVVAL